MWEGMHILYETMMTDGDGKVIKETVKDGINFWWDLRRDYGELGDEF